MLKYMVWDGFLNIKSALTRDNDPKATVQMARASSIGFSQSWLDSVHSIMSVWNEGWAEKEGGGYAY